MKIKSVCGAAFLVLGLSACSSFNSKPEASATPSSDRLPAANNSYANCMYELGKHVGKSEGIDSKIEILQNIFPIVSNNSELRDKYSNALMTTLNEKKTLQANINSTRSICGQIAQ